MKKLILTLILALVVLSPTAWASGRVFSEANQAYTEGSFEKAILLYEDLLPEYSKSDALYYNLGNAYFRTKKLGPAIFSYEKALMLNPRNADSRFNLKFVRGLLEYKIEDKRNWYVRTGEMILERFREQEILIIALLCYFLFIAGCLYSVKYKKGMPWGWKRKLMLVLFVLSLALLGAKNLETRFYKDAIVMQDQAEVRYGPSSTDQTAFRLGEGLKVYVLNKREDWSRIVLVNGEGGWIKNSNIKEVRRAI